MKKIHHRNIELESDDFQNMVALLSDIYGKGNHTWTLGRLYGWRYGLWTTESRNPEIFCKSAELFLDDNETLLGFIILESCGEGPATLFVPENEDKQVLENMIQFLDSGGNFDKEYSIYCSENNSQEVEFLRTHQYTVVNYQDTTFEYSAENIILPVVDLPNGFILTDETRFEDEDMLEQFRFSVFNPGVAFTEEIKWAYHYSRRNPISKKTLCIVLVDENKRPISSCVGYFDVENSDVEIEVVCTKKEEEGNGYAKAVIAECIRRAIEMGAKQINISGWNEQTKHLYSSFGGYTAVQKIEIKKEYKSR